MSRVKRFAANVVISISLAEEFADYARASLERALDGVQRGPRGGRYEMFGPLRHQGPAQVHDDWHRNTITFHAERDGRYVRPSR